MSKIKNQKKLHGTAKDTWANTMTKDIGKIEIRIRQKYWDTELKQLCKTDDWFVI